MHTALCWFRRDLRLQDNEALTAAMAHADQVIPVFVLDPILLTRYAGTQRVAFMLAGLRHLDAELRDRESRLVLRRGDPTQELATLVAQSGAEAIFAEEDFAPYARQRDEKVRQELPLRLVGQPTARPPGTVLKADGDPYIVFTPYSRRWKARSVPQQNTIRPAPDRIPTHPGIDSLPLPTEPALSAHVPFPAGEKEAARRLRTFTGGSDPAIYRYAETRNQLDLDGTSRLSPYLRFGMLSARQAVVAAYQAIASAPDDRARKGAETWLNELIWREFYVDILYHFPYVQDQSFRVSLRDIRWENDPKGLAAWRKGETGYPIVDAGMRQLAQSGWMHNRARMIVASFLVKDLLIDWRQGEKHFMQYLVDGDPASNNGGWQWTAGTGTDAAPYFRIFNPILQGKRHDPHGTYVRRWVPELATVPEKYLHTPWKMDIDEQQACGCVIGRDYPHPIVDHAQARERTLATYRAARKEHT